MSDSSSDMPAAGAVPPPFVRGRIEWSRPPRPLFRVAPPLRSSTTGSGTIASPGQGSRRAAGAGFFSGSMIPKAGSAPRPAPEPPVPTPPAIMPPVERQVPAEPAAPRAVQPEPTVTATPVVAPTAPTARPVVQSEPFVPHHPDPVAPRKGIPLLVWAIGGLVVLGVAAGAGWLLLKPRAPVPAAEAVLPARPQPVAPAPVEPEVVPAVPVEPDPVLVKPETVEEVRPARAPTPAPQAATAPARTTSRAPAPVPARAIQATPAASLTPRLNTERTMPPAETARPAAAPASPPPTAAERPAVDPDAPMQTRPQPLD